MFPKLQIHTYKFGKKKDVKSLFTIVSGSFSIAIDNFFLKAASAFLALILKISVPFENSPEPEILIPR